MGRRPCNCGRGVSPVSPVCARTGAAPHGAEEVRDDEYHHTACTNRHTRKHPLAPARQHLLRRLRRHLCDERLAVLKPPEHVDHLLRSRNPVLRLRRAHEV